MYLKKLVNFALVVCICLTAVNSPLFAEFQKSVDIDSFVNPENYDVDDNNLVINGNWDLPIEDQPDYDFVNFLPGAETAGCIYINAGGEAHLYGGTFNSEFGEIYEGWCEMSLVDGDLTVHGKNFWVGGVKIPDNATQIKLYIEEPGQPTVPAYPVSPYANFFNISWEHEDGTIYDIWITTNPVDIIKLSNEPYQAPTPNQAPVANAGGPYTAGSVDGGAVNVELTAAASTDADGTIAACNWDLDNDGTYETTGQTASSSFPVGTSTVGLVVVDNEGLQSAPVTTTVTVTKLAPEINVYPETGAHDFGDIEIGVSETFVIQVVNSGQGNLNISSISLAGSGDFQITAEPNAVNGVVVVAPDMIASTDIEITYTPSAEGIVQATLTIASDDADEPAVTVTLTGAGVIIEVPVVQQIENTITFYNASISDGTIVGYAPRAKAKTVANRVKALGNMLEAAGKLIEIGETQTAIDQLKSIAKKTDGQKSPPDFVIGDGVAELNQKVNDMITALSQ